MPSPSIIIDGEALTADDALESIRDEDSFHEQPSRETPPYGRSYPVDFQSVARKLAALRREREAELRQEQADLLEFPPHVIARECKAIQKTWTRRERAKRAGVFGRIAGTLCVTEAKFTEGFL